MIRFLIHEQETGQKIKWRYSLKDFCEKFLDTRNDNVRRVMATTYDKDFFYRGYKIIRKNIKEEPKKRNVLCIPDIHAPFNIEGSLEFCKQVHYSENITDVIMLGDILDNHFSSFHNTDPNGYGGGDELNLAKRELSKWYKAFPNAIITEGNHTRNVVRKAFSGGIPVEWIKSYNEVLGVPNWKFVRNHTIGDFYFCHGDNQVANSRAKDLCMSVVQGHYHSKFSIDMISSNDNKNTYAIQCGCLIDKDKYAFKYAEGNKGIKLGCVVIKDIENNPTIKMIPFPKKK